MSESEEHPTTPGPSKPKDPKSKSDVKKDSSSERDIRHMERAYQQQQQEITSMRKQLQDVLAQRDADLAHMRDMEARMKDVMVHGGDNDGAGDYGSGHDDDHSDQHVSSDQHEHDDDDDGGMVVAGPVIAQRSTPLELPKIPKSIKAYTGEGGASVRLWLQQFDTMREPLGWSDRQSIVVCAMYLHDRAQQWYQEEGSRVGRKGSWKLFSAALQKRFTPTVNKLFIPKYTRNLSQKHNEKSVDFMDRVRRELRDLGVDDEGQVVRVFASGLHDWIMEPLTMVVGDDHKMSAKILLDHCTRI